MKLILVGASGTIGQHVADALSHHEIIKASRSHGDVKVDINTSSSIKSLFEEVGPVDGVVSMAGGAPMKPFAELTEVEMMEGFRNKLMGQLNLVLIGQHYVNDGGNFSLVSGILSQEPIKNGAVLTTVNGAINAFTISAARELLPRGIRVNTISPALVEDSVEALGAYFPGQPIASMEAVARAFVKSVEGIGTGEIIPVIH